MAKLNLSALKKQAGNADPKSDDIILSNVAESEPQLIVSEVATPAQIVTVQDASEVKLSTSSLATSETATALQSVREFFPNLTVGTKYEMDDVLKSTTEIQTIPMSEITPPNEFKPDTLEIQSLPIESSVAIENTVLPSVEALEQVENTPQPEASPPTGDNYVQSVAEDLSKAREGGLARFTTGKKVALVSVSGIVICAAVFVGLYSLGIFPASKASVIEVPNPPIIIPVKPPIPVASLEQTGAVLAASGATSSGITLPLTGQSNSGTILFSTGVLSSTGVTLSSVNTGSTFTGALVLTSSTNTGTVLPARVTNTGANVPPPTPPSSVTGSVLVSSGSTLSSIRTPNIRIPRIQK